MRTSGVVLVAFSLLVVGCAGSGDYNPSMDYNPAWDMDAAGSMTFDDLPRHKNRLEKGVR